ncbi:hypothetical protein [Methanogenium cariaci]|uniref:hypothetical protein n=1 Tax=Methanogenium cariaci TaxID=2197 RepID=UPI0012F65C0B|nr:hypothetical protein [Methanogenium cariaci]
MKTSEDVKPKKTKATCLLPPDIPDHRNDFRRDIIRREQVRCLRPSLMVQKGGDTLD